MLIRMQVGRRKRGQVRCSCSAPRVLDCGGRWRRSTGCQVTNIHSYSICINVYKAIIVYLSVDLLLSIAGDSGTDNKAFSGQTTSGAQPKNTQYTRGISVQQVNISGTHNIINSHAITPLSQLSIIEYPFLKIFVL